MIRWSAYTIAQPWARDWVQCASLYMEASFMVAASCFMPTDPGTHTWGLMQCLRSRMHIHAYHTHTHSHTCTQTYTHTEACIHTCSSTQTHPDRHHAGLRDMTAWLAHEWHNGSTFQIVLRAEHVLTLCNMPRPQASPART